MVAHRDLKPSNLLIADNMLVKLIDFGMSTVTRAGIMHTTMCGTPAYAAPEIINGTKYFGTAVDVWSLGVRCP